MRAVLQRVLDEAEARQLPALIAEWGGRNDPLRWVALALQLDLAFLIEHPELVVPCLVRRTVGFDDPDAYRQRARIPSDAGELCALVEGLVEAWEPRGPWLRAVRPPRYPLEAGVIEEYRSAGEGAVWFSADDAVVGVGDQGWERATGRRFDGAQRWRGPARWRRGHHALVSAGREVPLPLTDEDPRSVLELQDDLVIVTYLTSVDHQWTSIHYLIDTVTGRSRWRADHGCYAARIVGDRLYATDSDGCVIRELATGAELERWMLCRPDDVDDVRRAACSAFSARGLLAALDDGVLRIWDLARAVAPVAGVRVTGKVELSPDGTRAIVGSSLIDARSGRVLAELEPPSGERLLEGGGPPRNCFGLVDGYVIQVMPDGVDVWRTADGARLFQRSEMVRGAAYDLVGYDPKGRLVALYEHFRRTIEVFELPGLILRATFAANLDPYGIDSECLGVSDDGSHLWWMDVEEGGRIVDTAGLGTPRPLPAPPPSRRSTVELACPDGLLVYGAARAPVDDPRVVVAAGGASFLTAHDHYRLIT